MTPDSLIYLRVPAATKGRWVRASRAAGMRLTDWVVDAVEVNMQQRQARDPMTRPLPAEVVKLRESIQARSGLGITAAQDLCAEMLHTSRRAWQQWERGERKMHPAFWELISIKCAMRTKSPSASTR